MTPRARVILHAGTHKTGTKTLQAFLMENRLSFARAGIYVPAAGRAELAPGALSPGHHALAWDVLGGNTTELAAVLADIEAARPPVVIVSSEEFVHLHARPERAVFLREAFGACGFDVTIVLYVRSQAPYAESLYAELTKGGAPPPFGAFLADLLDHGAVHLGESAMSFEYDRMVLAFAAIFGTQHVVVRPYVEGAHPRALIDDFLRVVARLCGGLELRDLQVSLPHANVRGAFGHVIARYVERLGERIAGQAPLDESLAVTPFAPLRHADTLALVHRFAASNAALEAMTRITIPGTRPADIADASDPRWETSAAQRAILDRIANAVDVASA